jgi:hypothetical protein
MQEKEQREGGRGKATKRQEMKLDGMRGLARLR